MEHLFEEFGGRAALSMGIKVRHRHFCHGADGFEVFERHAVFGRDGRNFPRLLKCVGGLIAGDKPLIHEGFEHTADGAFAEDNAMIPFKNDGEFGFAVGGVVSSEGEDELACGGGDGTLA